MNTLNVEQLQQWKRQNKDFLLLNVLDQDKFAKQHIPGSKNVPLSSDSFVEGVARLSGTKDRDVVVYCASTECDASEKAAKKLEDAGFTNVHDFEGGTKAWSEADQPLASAAS